MFAKPGNIRRIDTQHAAENNGPYGATTCCFAWRALLERLMWGATGCSDQAPASSTKKICVTIHHMV